MQETAGIVTMDTSRPAAVAEKNFTLGPVQTSALADDADVFAPEAAPPIKAKVEAPVWSIDDERDALPSAACNLPEIPSPPACGALPAGLSSGVDFLPPVAPLYNHGVPVPGAFKGILELTGSDLAAFLVERLAEMKAERFAAFHDLDESAEAIAADEAPDGRPGGHQGTRRPGKGPDGRGGRQASRI